MRTLLALMLLTAPAAAQQVWTPAPVPNVSAPGVAPADPGRHAHGYGRARERYAVQRSTAHCQRKRGSAGRADQSGQPRYTGQHGSGYPGAGQIRHQRRLTSTSPPTTHSSPSAIGQPSGSPSNAQLATTPNSGVKNVKADSRPAG